jgi:small subunit ribosomal protein S5
VNVAQYYDDAAHELIEKVIAVNRTAKVVKGGRRFSFAAIVVVGDGKGNVGLGFGKANEVSDAIAKALTDGRRQMVPITLYRTTIPFGVEGKFKGGRVMLKPATSGTGIIAGGAVRAVVEATGIRDILSKSLGSSNPLNVAKATMEALLSLTDMRTAFMRRGIELKEPRTPLAQESAAPQPAPAETVQA